MAAEIRGELSLQGGRGNSWLLHLIKIWGPAWLVMIADVDAASVITAAESGAQQGTHLIWFLLVLTLPLYVIQEVAGRVGAVTGKGLGELIRENYSRRVAVLAAVPMALVDMISYVVEYTGIAIGFQILGVSPRISVPAVFLTHLLVVYKRKYADAEKPLLIISILFNLAWLGSALLTARRGDPVHAILFFLFPQFSVPDRGERRRCHYAVHALLSGFRNRGEGHNCEESVGGEARDGDRGPRV